MLMRGGDDERLTNVQSVWPFKYAGEGPPLLYLPITRQISSTPRAITLLQP